MINYDRTELLNFIDSYMDTQTTFAWAREVVARIVKCAMRNEDDIIVQHKVYLFINYFKIFFAYYAHECNKSVILFALYYIGVEFDVISVQDDILKTEEIKEYLEEANWKEVTKASIMKTDMMYADQIFKFYVDNADAYCPCGGLYTLNAVRELEEIYGS